MIDNTALRVEEDVLSVRVCCSLHDNVLARLCHAMKAPFTHTSTKNTKSSMKTHVKSRETAHTDVQEELPVYSSLHIQCGAHATLKRNGIKPTQSPLSQPESFSRNPNASPRPPGFLSSSNRVAPQHQASRPKSSLQQHHTLSCLPSYYPRIASPGLLG